MVWIDMEDSLEGTNYTDSFYKYVSEKSSTSL